VVSIINPPKNVGKVRNVRYFFRTAALNALSRCATRARGMAGHSRTRGSKFGKKRTFANTSQPHGLSPENPKVARLTPT
jgi:hypothetical protein